MPITLISASLIGLLLIYLSWGVVKERQRTKVSIGDGGDDRLHHAIRAHSNLIEYAPIALILFGLLESNGANHWLMIALSTFFVVGRYMHGVTFGKFEGRNPFRFYGTLFTWLTILFASITGVLMALHVI
ncbi:MAPEG family protein [Kordiimonas sp. SCSIO 12603]|uniref:MAPEG family protein n=1 Tax=Kordiimonas sp. SCSIO 12603 TaxID=2829596 RepID=UPI002105C65E|nr:MAPEG family protein [Kordiimonas sp. SCSIO 12603]UTW58448.1 MAPEG family protein [Kordiimonas sp. SCSIO 12603]